MSKILIGAGGMIGSYLGWWLGGVLLGDMGSILFSTIFGIAGIYVGWKVSILFF